MTRSPLLPRFFLSGVLLVLATLAGETWAAEQRGRYFGAKATEYPAWFKESFLNLREDIAEAAAANKRVLIVFHQDNCPYCNLLVERNLSQKDIVDLMQARFDTVAINMWGDREVTDYSGSRMTEKQFAAALKVQFTPTLLFFDEQGQVVLRLNGYLPPQRFKLALEYVANRKEKELPFREFMARHEPPPASGTLHGEDFFAAPPHDLRRVRQPIAVFFEQKDCPACDMLHDKVLTDAETRQVVKKLYNLQLDMWSDTPVILPDGRKTTAREWARQLDVKYAPTIVIMDARGKEIIRSEAFFKVFHTQGMFAYAVTGAYRKEPSFQRYLSARAEALREQGRDVDIWRFADEPPGPR
ncbi:thioredoxin family protein [Thiobacter aerophilum]|uniref:Thioredoxin fold domain-containing protein n=1 Tax=Thiobacter aerophilum TaxID=3121275 RepID=A0ABV0EJQ8_9BURK